MTKFQKYLLWFSLGVACAAILVGGLHRLWFSDDLDVSKSFTYVLALLIMCYYINAAVSAVNAIIQLFSRKWKLALYSFAFIPLQLMLFSVTILVDSSVLYMTMLITPGIMIV